jgi:hypothetical protein
MAANATTIIKRAFPIVDATQKLGVYCPPHIHRNLFILRLPLHGSQNAVLGRLLRSFYVEFMAVAEPHYCTENEQLANTILRGITFSYDNRDTLRSNVSGRTPSLHHQDPPDPNISPITQSDSQRDDKNPF